MNKKILFGTLLLFLIVLSACSKIDNKNEQILEKILSLENISVNNVVINNQVIFVSIEASEAGQYDSQLINWWGTIFGLSSLLKSEQEYKFIIIENTVNKEPYVYLGVNRVSVIDYDSGTITDVEFWQEVLITEKNPSTTDIVNHAGLPAETLKIERTTKTHKWLWWLLPLFILLVLVFYFFKNPAKIGKIYGTLINKNKKSKKNNKNKLKKTLNDVTKKTSIIAKDVSKQAAQKSKIVFEKTKIHSQNAVVKGKETSKKIFLKTKEQTIKIKNIIKNKIDEFKEASKTKK